MRIPRKKVNTKTAALLMALASCGWGQAQSPEITTLYAFTDGYDGAQPYGGVAVGGDGVLYGTAIQGGEYNGGVVFSLRPPASPGGAWKQTVLHEFDLVGDGYSSNAGVAIGTGGVLYGTTESGGTANAGTVFSLTPPTAQGDAWTYATLHSFSGSLQGGPDGYRPTAGLVIGSGGVLYGTTWSGGEYALGTAFSLKPPAAPGGAWIETVLHSFGSATDGSIPYAGLVIGNGGVLYGPTNYSPETTKYGSGCGTIYSLTPPASVGGAWTYATLFDFDSNGCAGGAYPDGNLTVGSGGQLYGTTCGGLITLNPGGVVFSLKPPASAGGAWTESVVYGFDEVKGYYPEGGCPEGALLIGPNGALVGTTAVGGGLSIDNVGTLFKLSPPESPGSAWTHEILYRFTAEEGNPIVQTAPAAGVVAGPGGALYGTTTGAQFFELGYGTVYSVTP
jgi:uncharacterized repeat protein (TIGR03803 family)